MSFRHPMMLCPLIPIQMKGLSYIGFQDSPLNLVRVFITDFTVVKQTKKQQRRHPIVGVGTAGGTSLHNGFHGRETNKKTAAAPPDCRGRHCRWYEYKNEYEKIDFKMGVAGLLPCRPKKLLSEGL